MKRLLFIFVVPVLGLVGASASRSAARAADVRFTPDAAAKQVAVSIGGKPFTTYRYGPEFEDKSVFYPVISPNGARVNREFPMVTGVPGESTDHPHHQSVFFAYDEVNGTNFWNPEKTGRKIEQVGTPAASGDRLTLTRDWKDKDGKGVLRESAGVTFGGAADVFWMDYDSVLNALVPVTMGDTKEGAFGIRLNDTLKEAGGSGRYINADGLETSAKVWGKTSNWVAIRGSVKDKDGDKPVTVAIYAHPAGLNAPPYWHARDYGLFAVNPFARKGYDPTLPERITKVAVGASVRMRYRLAVYSNTVEKTRLDQDYQAFAASPLASADKK